SSRLRVAWVLDDRYHQANAKVATMTGITTTSMIAVELSRSSRSAAAIGPCGSNIPAGAQDASRMAAPTAGQQRRRERGGPCSKPGFLIGRLDMANSPQRRRWVRYAPLQLISWLHPTCL